MDKAKSSHYKSKWVIKYFEENKDILIPVYLLTTTSPEFMVIIKEVWNMDKRDLLILKYYTSFGDLKKKISLHVRTKRFILDMRNYLLREL